MVVSCLFHGVGVSFWSRNASDYGLDDNPIISHRALLLCTYSVAIHGAL